MQKFLTSRVFRTTAIVAALVGLYALLGFQAAPRLIRNQAIEFVQENYGRTLAIGEVRVNPFRFQLEIRDVAFPDSDQKVLVGCRRLFVDFEAAASIWNRAFTFRDIDLEVPALRAVIRRDGALNLAELALPEDSGELEEQGEALPDVWVHSLVVTDGTVDFLHHARTTPFERRFTPISFELENFRTTPAGGGFGLAAQSQHGEKFEWQGRFALAPEIASQGEFSIAGLRATGIAEFLADALPFGLTKGLVSIDGRYDVKLGESLALQAELPKVELADLSLRARGADADWLAVPSIVLSATRVSLPQQTVSIDAIDLTGMTAQVWKSADGSINLHQLFAPAPDAGAATTNTTASMTTATEPATAASTSDAPSGETPWQIAISSVSLRDAAVSFEDRALTPAVQFAIAPVNVGITGVSLETGEPLPVTFDAAINGKASLKGAGQLTPDPLVADFELELVGFDLTDLQPYVAASTDMTVRRGTLGLQGKFGLAPTDSDAPEASFAGDVTVTGFKSTDNALNQDFFNVARLELRKFRYTMRPDALSIDRIRLVRPFNRVVIASNQVLNVAAVFDPEGTEAAVKASEAAAAAKLPESSRKQTRAEVRAEKKAAEAAAKARAAVPPPPAQELRETGMPIRIRELRLEDGRMDFEDLSIEPNFAADIIALNGTVTGLSSNPTSRATVDIKGLVGEFSPVTIAGGVQPFAYDRHTDIGLKFENISLPIFNPYSGKFAGYNIAKGKLTTDLHYTIADRRLDSKHHIRIDQLEWGEATAEKTEATLPVKFATSLLKDADGVINLDIPVKGTLDDPKFRIGPIVWQIIKNILTKAVTAPFRALAALFKDAEEAQFVEFAPGQAALDPATTTQLAGLARALAPKADIRLNVPIGTLAELDVAALTEQRYAVALQAAMTQVVRGSKAADDQSLPAFDTLGPDQKLDVLTALVRQVTRAPPKLPPPVEPPEGTSRKEAKAIAQAASIEFLATEARANVAPDASALDRLGQQRAETIESALLTGTGLDPQRVFLIKDGKVAAQDGKVRLELAME